MGSAVVDRSRRWQRGRNGVLLVPGDGALVFGGGAVVVGSVLAFWAFATGVSPDTWVPVLVFVGLMIVSVPIVLWTAGDDRRLKRILLMGLVLKLLAVGPRYYMNEKVYEGSADAGQYHDAGVVLYRNMHDEGQFSLDGAAVDNYSDETRTVGYITGAVYLVVGTSKVGGFLAFAWLGWLGLLCFLRAFRVAYPNAPPYLAAGLLFFLPSLLYWPSSLGKDAVMMCALGVLTLGIARLVTPARPWLGLIYLVPAALVILQVRPHLLMVALVGGAASMVARNASRGRSAASAASRIVLLVALVPLLLMGLSRMDEMFGETQEESSFTVSSALERTTEQTSTGNSAFETEPVNNPLDMPVAVISVLFRPFPFEVDGGPALISSLEGALLLILAFVALHWIWRIGPAMYRHPFAAFCGGYVLAFVFAFSNVANAGILARQRVQLFPFVVLLVAAAREHYRTRVESPAPEVADAGLPALGLSRP